MNYINKQAYFLAHLVGLSSNVMSLLPWSQHLHDVMHTAENERKQIDVSGKGLDGREVVELGWDRWDGRD